MPLTMRKYFPIILLMLEIPLAQAQFNDSTNYYINHTSTGIVNKTNDGSSYVLNNAIRFNFYRKHVSVNTTNSWIYGEQRNQRTNNDFMSMVDFDLYKTLHKVYYWG